jgi:Bacteriophage Sf6, terminase small subunit-like
MRKPAGRKSKYSRLLARKICNQIAAGETLSSICSDPEMPCRSTVYRWLQSDEKFDCEYAMARKAQTDALADSIVDIADQAELGRDELAKAKLRIDARKWLVGRFSSERTALDDVENVQVAGETSPPQLTVQISGIATTNKNSK